MDGTDYVHTTRQVTYTPPASPAEKTLSEAAAGPAPIGAVNLTWDRAGHGIWPNA